MSGTIEATIFGGLTADTALAALIGTRLYPVRFLQGAALPNITYQRIDTPRQYLLGSDDTDITPRFQFSIRAGDFDTCRAVANALRPALNALSPNLTIVDERDLDETEAELYRTDIDVTLFTEERLS